MKKHIIILLTILITTASYLSTAQSSNTPSKDKKPNSALSTYDVILPVLKKKTQIPIILPPASILYKKVSLDQTLAKTNIQFAYRYAYSINFDYTADCNGAPVCSAGNFYMTKLNVKVPKNNHESFPLTAAQLASLQQNQTIAIPRHKRILLSNNIYGYLEDPHATGSGSSLFQTLTWISHDTLYQLTLKTNPASLIAIANATITA